MSFLVLHVFLRWLWVLGGNRILHTPSLTVFFGPAVSYLSGTLRLLSNLPQFHCDRANVITGKYSTALKSICSLWTLVKFIASLRQIAVNKIAAFWLDTDRKKIVLKKIIASIHHLYLISRVVCCKWSPWGSCGKYYLNLPEPDNTKKYHDTTWCRIPTFLAKGCTWISG